MILEDGTGSGAKAEVTLSNQLRVRSSTTHVMTSRGFQKMAFVAATPVLPITHETNRVFWFKNNRVLHHVHVDKLWLMWNGGNTNKNRACIATMYISEKEPDGNMVQIPVGNMWLGDQTPLDLQCRIWNGAGTGMTFDSDPEGGGSQGATTIARQGPNVIETHAMIIPYGTAIGFKILGEEAGLVSAMLSGYLCDDRAGE